MQKQLASIFDISSLEDVTLEMDDKAVSIQGTLPGLNLCPRCNSVHIHRKTRRHRRLHLAPVGGKAATLQVMVQKQECVDCKHSWWPSLSCASGKKRVTSSFERYALELLRFCTIQDVSNHLGVGWDLIKSLHKSHLQRLYGEIDMSEVEYVSVDEFSIAKGHKYMTVFMNIANGQILEAVEGRKRDDIAPVLNELKKKHPTLKLSRWT